MSCSVAGVDAAGCALDCPFIAASTCQRMSKHLIRLVAQRCRWCLIATLAGVGGYENYALGSGGFSTARRFAAAAGIG